MNRLSGHEDCGIAIGISNEPTFGKGILNDYGYWQFPCEKCAREWEKQNPNSGKAWPSSNEDAEHEKYKKRQRELYHKKREELIEDEVKEEIDEDDVEEISQFA